MKKKAANTSKPLLAQQKRVTEVRRQERQLECETREWDRVWGGRFRAALRIDARMEQLNECLAEFGAKLEPGIRQLERLGALRDRLVVKSARLLEQRIASRRAAKNAVQVPRRAI